MLLPQVRMKTILRALPSATVVLLLGAGHGVWAQCETDGTSDGLGDVVTVLDSPAVTQPSRGSLDDPPTADEGGRICYYDSDLDFIEEYRLTPDDLVFLAKVIDGETWGNPSGEDASMMLWTLAQRKRIGRFRNWTMQRLGQAYSQPINPIWTKQGRMCRAFYPGGTKFTGTLGDRVDNVIDGLDSSDYPKYGLRSNWSADRAKRVLRARWDACVERRVNRRYDNIHNREWKDLAPEARRVTLDFAGGRDLVDDDGNPLPRDARAIGWFAPATWKTSQEGRVFAAEVDGNVYYANETWATTDDWTEDMTVVVPAGESCPTHAAGE